MSNIRDKHAITISRMISGRGCHIPAADPSLRFIKLVDISEKLMPKDNIPRPPTTDLDQDRQISISVKSRGNILSHLWSPLVIYELLRLYLVSEAVFGLMLPCPRVLTTPRLRPDPRVLQPHPQLLAREKHFQKK
jgi:hypothetical protein